MRRSAVLMTVAAGLCGVGPTISAAELADKNGVILDGHYFASIVRLKDGSLIAEDGRHSTDGGRPWRKSDTFHPAGNRALLRLPSGELGACQGTWSMDDALGNGSNNWSFRRSADEGKTWSDPVTITLPGLT